MKVQFRVDLNKSNQIFEFAVLDSNITASLLNLVGRRSAKAPHKVKTDRINGIYM